MENVKKIINTPIFYLYELLLVAILILFASKTYIKMVSSLIGISVFLLLGIVIAFSLTWKKRSLARGIMIMIAIVNIYVIYNLLSSRNRTLIIIACSYIVTFIVISFIAYFRILRRRIRIKVFATIAGELAVCVLAILLLFNRCFPENIKNMSCVSEQDIIKKYGDIFSDIYSFEFYTYDANQRFELCKEVIYFGAEYYGTESLPLKISDEMDIRTVAMYAPGDECIYINRLFLVSLEGEELIESLLHESRHVWQYQMWKIVKDLPDDYVNLKGMREIKEFDFEHYIEGEEETFYDYYHQAIEQDARECAEELAEELKYWYY